MSLLSLEKYLYNSSKSSPVEEKLPIADGYFRFTGEILENFSRSLLTGEGFADLCKELDTIRTTLTPRAEKETLGIAGTQFSTLLQQFKKKLHRADEERAEDLRKLLVILNEAFMLFGSLSDRSDVRLKKLESSLQQASKLDDIRTLKTHLAEVLSYVKKEAAEERSSAPVQVEALGSQIRQIQKLSRHLKASIPARDEAMAELKALLRGSAHTGCYRYAALFVADSLNAMRTRHGNDIADGLLEQLAKQDLRSLVPEGKVFCWSANSILLLWQPENAQGNLPDLGKRIKSPYEYRALVGSRMATFTMGLRSAVMSLQADFGDTVKELDRFERGAGRC